MDLESAKSQLSQFVSFCVPSQLTDIMLKSFHPYNVDRNFIRTQFRKMEDSLDKMESCYFHIIYAIYILVKFIYYHAFS